MVMAASALWFFIGLMPLLAVTTFHTHISNPVVFGIAIVHIGYSRPATAAVHAMMARILDKEEVLVREFFRHFSTFARSVVLYCLGCNLAILASDLFLPSITRISSCGCYRVSGFTFSSFGP